MVPEVSFNFRSTTFIKVANSTGLHKVLTLHIEYNLPLLLTRITSPQNLGLPFAGRWFTHVPGPCALFPSSSTTSLSLFFFFILLYPSRFLYLSPPLSPSPFPSICLGTSAWCCVCARSSSDCRTIGLSAEAKGKSGNSEA